MNAATSATEARLGEGRDGGHRLRVVAMLASALLFAGCAHSPRPCPGGTLVHTPSLDVCLTNPPVSDDFACPDGYPLRAETCDGCCAACTAVIPDPTLLSSILASACPRPPDAGPG